jgi:hypothetical protein
MIKIHTGKGELFLDDDGPMLSFGKGFPSSGQPCTAESMASLIPSRDLRALGAFARTLPFRKLAREALLIQGRLVAK